MTFQYCAPMTADISALERIFDRLVRTLSAGGPDQLAAPFTVAEIVQSLVPYRTYRHELGVDTLQDYEHSLLQLLTGERGWLVCDADTVAVIRKELASPDPDTGLLRRLATVQVRMGAIRMPVTVQTRQPVARPEEDARDTPLSERHPNSDAMTFGAGMRDDELEHILAEAPAAAAVVPPSQAESPKDGGESAPTTPHAWADAAKEALATPIVSPELPSISDLPMIAQPAAPALTTPLQSVHGVTLANPLTLSRITPLSVPSIYGDPIEFRGVRHAPVDVGGVIFLFGMVARELGFNVEALSSGFPRCEAKRQVSPGKWLRLRIDFEHESRQFRDAGRNPAACDLIVCWRDTWPDRPSSMDVLSLERVLPTLSSRD